MKFKSKSIALLLSLVMLITGFPIVNTRAFPNESKIDVCTDSRADDEASASIVKKIGFAAAKELSSEIAPSEKSTAPDETQASTTPAEPTEPPTAEKNAEAVSECTCGSENGIHSTSCPLYAETNVNTPVTKRELTDGVVTVSGYIPEGVELVVENYSFIRMFSFLENVQVPLARLNVTLYNPDGSEWQPEEGKPVSVTLDAAALGLNDGYDYIVSHIHEDEVTGESTTNFVTAPSNGKMTFELTGFSYVLVFDSVQNYTINNVDVFYSVDYTAETTNNQVQFLGIYYDTDGNTHFLIAAIQQIDNVMKQIKSITVDNTTFQKDDIYLLENAELKFTTVKFKADNSDEILQEVKIKENAATGIIDFNVGKLEIGNEFNFAINGDQSGKGWKVIGNGTINLDYSLTKAVAKGTNAFGTTFADSVTVERGDWVIYKITVDNAGTMPLTGMTVTDILPQEVFVPGSVMMGIGDESGIVADWQSFNEILFSNYSSPGKFSRALYIRAQVKPELNINTPTVYVNTAKIDGNNMPTFEDTAEITVNSPKAGRLTVSKAVTSENPMDPAEPNAKFSFTVSGGNGFNETFILGNGESMVFENFPVGNFTVAETQTDGYTTTVNGDSTNVYSGYMNANDAPVIAFENRFTARNTTLSITKKVDKSYVNDVLPEDDFKFRLSVSGVNVPDEYTYTMDGGASGKVENNGIITLKHDQTAFISGIPVGAEYTVTEVDIPEGYEFYFVSGGTPDLNFETGGKLTDKGASITFTNIYKRHLADLTISKTGAAEIDENQSFVFHVTGEGYDGTKVDLNVIIHGNYKATVKDLPIGKYTVTEETKWSWRYKPENESVQFDLTADGKNVDFANTRTAEKWLNGCAWCDNRWIDEKAYATITAENN